MKISDLKLFWIDLENYKKILYEKKIKINIYQTAEWLKIISLTKNIDIKFLVFQNKSKIISITPCTNKKFLFVNFFGCPLSGTFSLYNGIILNGNYSEQELSMLIWVQTKFLKKFASYTEYIFDERLKDILQINKVFKKLQFKFYLSNSFLLDLETDKSILWRDMEGRAINSIRKAKKNKIKIKFDEPNRDWIINFYEMLKNTFNKSNRMPPHSLNFYLNLIQLPKDKIRFVSASKEQDILSKAIFLIDNNKIIYFSGTSNQLGYKLSANAFLLWEVISNNNIENIKYFDFGGAGNQAIDKFKQSFGGKNISYYRWVKCNFFVEKMKESEWTTY